MHVDNEDKLIRQIVVSGQNRNVILINESGLYSLIKTESLYVATKINDEARMGKNHLSRNAGWTSMIDGGQRTKGLFNHLPHFL